MSQLQPVQFLAEAYASILSDSFALFGSRPTVTWTVDTSAADSSSEDAPALWWVQPFDMEKGAEAMVGAPDNVWSSLADIVVMDKSGGDADLRGAYLEFVRQTMSDLADALSSAGPNSIRVLPGRETGAPSELPLRLAMEVRYKDRTITPLWLGCTSSFLSSVHQMLTAGAARDAQPTAETTQGKDRTSKFDVLLDVEMPITVSFGKASLPLKDVMKLAVGSIVELNRKSAEPVEVIINNCVVARGEVVVVEGSYGLRLLEIVGEHERLSLR